MNHQIRIGLFGITLAGALAMTSPGALAQERFVTIGTGGQTGVYYTAGLPLPQSRRGEAGHQVQRTRHRWERDQHRGVAER